MFGYLSTRGPVLWCVCLLWCVLVSGGCTSPTASGSESYDETVQNRWWRTPYVLDMRESGLVVARTTTTTDTLKGTWSTREGVLSCKLYVDNITHDLGGTYSFQERNTGMCMIVVGGLSGDTCVWRLVPEVSYAR